MKEDRKLFMKDGLTALSLFVLSYFFFTKGVMLLVVPLAIAGAGMVGFILFVFYVSHEEDRDGENH